MDTSITNNKIARVVKKGEEPDDVSYWLSRPATERLLAVEQIREEYNIWKYGTQQRFQRVCKVIKRKRR